MVKAGKRARENDINENPSPLKKVETEDGTIVAVVKSSEQDKENIPSKSTCDGCVCESALPEPTDDSLKAEHPEDTAEPEVALSETKKSGGRPERATKQSKVAETKVDDNEFEADWESEEDYDEDDADDDEDDEDDEDYDPDEE